VNAIVGLAEILGMADLSKVEAGRMTLHPASVPIAPLLEELAATTRLLLVSRPVDVIVDAREAPAALVVDRQRLHQILLNFLSNAAKFTEAGTVELGAARAGDAVRFWVRDSGCGIKSEDLDRLFQPFGQLEDARTKAHAGTGLGLVISQSLARLLGGRIAVESSRGEGSRFTLHLTTGTLPEENVQ
jgi:signal transduction histidine kinase